METYYSLRNGKRLTFSCISKSKEELEKKINSAFGVWKGWQSRETSKTINDFLLLKNETRVVIKIEEISPQPVVQADANNKCPKCGEPEPVFYCENCGCTFT